MPYVYDKRFEGDRKKNMFEWVNAKLGVAILVAIVIIISIVVFFHINSMCMQGRLNFSQAEFTIAKQLASE